MTPFMKLQWTITSKFILGQRRRKETTSKKLLSISEENISVVYFQSLDKELLNIQLLIFQCQFFQIL